MNTDQLDMGQVNALLQTAGLVTDSGGLNMAGIVANLVFGTIGFCALVYGWKNREPKPLSIGLALSILPFLVPNTWVMIFISLALTSLLFFWRS